LKGEAYVDICYNCSSFGLVLSKSVIIDRNIDRILRYYKNSWYTHTRFGCAPRGVK